MILFFSEHVCALLCSNNEDETEFWSPELRMDLHAREAPETNA
jgi:hypothetical protein